MKPSPNRAGCGIGGATPYPGHALTESATGARRSPSRTRYRSQPAAAAMAALAWHTNQTVTALVTVAFAAATLARRQGESVAHGIERSLPEGRARDAATAAAAMYIAGADAAARAAMRFGRHFGHLAFAFPRSF
jgi:hypothetical protein